MRDLTKRGYFISNKIGKVIKDVLEGIFKAPLRGRSGYLGTKQA